MRFCPQCNLRTRNDICETCKISTIEDHTRNRFGDRLLKRFGLVREADSNLVGMVIDRRFKVSGLIDAGGMGEVYRAHRLSTHQDVAVKVMLKEFTRNEEFIRRFFREALSASRLSHPNIVEVSDFGQLPDGRLYMVMEYLVGCTLRDAIRQARERSGGGVEPRRAICIAKEICKALNVAHRTGVIHRDLKPDNIFLTDAGDEEIVKVVDFGISKVLESSEETLTGTGIFLGTPSYSSPEQARAGDLDGRADLYSLGVLLYEMLCGHTPFTSKDKLAVLAMNISEPPPPLEEQVLPWPIPKDLFKIVYRLLEKAPSDRYPTTRECLDALENINFKGKTPRIAARKTVAYAGTAGIAHARTPVSEPRESLPQEAKPVERKKTPAPEPVRLDVPDSQEAEDPFRDPLFESLPETTPLAQNSTENRSEDPLDGIDMRPRWVRHIKAIAAALILSTLSLWGLYEGILVCQGPVDIPYGPDSGADVGQIVPDDGPESIADLKVSVHEDDSVQVMDVAEIPVPAVAFPDSGAGLDSGAIEEPSPRHQRGKKRATRTVIIKSRPPVAWVKSKAGRVLGRTPKPVRLKPGQSRTLTVGKQGFVSKTIHVRYSQKKRETIVTLRPSLAIPM